MAKDIFISYSRKDLELVTKIKEIIETSTHANCWMDLDEGGVDSGDPNFTKTIIDAINTCPIFLFMLSRESQVSPYALKELDFAYKKYREEGKKVVIVNIDKCKMNDVFCFEYSKTDIIDWELTEQQSKLIRDLRLWTGYQEKEKEQRLIESRNRKYDIFISYRRDGGAQYARILQLMLIQRGYKVFLDYDELTDGIFSNKIKAAIKEAPVFMLVLSKGSMERCANDGDWVRQEITLAVEQNKHIIPVNPDNGFDGFPIEMPQDLKEFIGSHQHSEISFGQALGATIDLLIKNRLVPTLGERVSNEHKDIDYDAAQESLKRIDAHNRFMKRMGIVSAVLLIVMVLGVCFWFWKHQNVKEQQENEMIELSVLRSELEKKHKDFGLQLSPNLTMRQMKTVNNILMNMTEVRPGILWMSQFECTKGQWYGILGGDYDEAQESFPMTEVSYGQICMLFLDSLRNMTNIGFYLPSVKEWEYAAHGGENKETTLYVGDDDIEKVAWYKDNSDGKPHPSDGQQGKDPNTLDLYDMSGNVSELCNSPFDENGLFTVCGGNYESPASEVTVTSRKGIATDAKDKKVGFRIIIRKE
jgi:hypothetical protein